MFIAIQSIVFALIILLNLAIAKVGLASPVDCGDQLHIREYFDLESEKREEVNASIQAYKNNLDGLPPRTYPVHEILVMDRQSIFALKRAENIILGLRQGDRIRFFNGEKIVLGAFLGAGNFSHIFAVASHPGWVVRFPRALFSRGGPEGAMFAYHMYNLSYQTAVQSGIPVIPVEFREGLAFTREIKPFEDLKQFRKRLMVPTRLTEGDRYRLRQLAVFIQLLKGKPGLEDLHLGQIGFFEGNWIIFDWGGIRKYDKPTYWHGSYEGIIQSLYSTLKYPEINPVLSDAQKNVEVQSINF